MSRERVNARFGGVLPFWLLLEEQNRLVEALESPQDCPWSWSTADFDVVTSDRLPDYPLQIPLNAISGTQTDDMYTWLWGKHFKISEEGSIVILFPYARDAERKDNSKKDRAPAIYLWRAVTPDEVKLFLNRLTEELLRYKHLKLFVHGMVVLPLTEVPVETVAVPEPEAMLLSDAETEDSTTLSDTPSFDLIDEQLGKDAVLGQ